MPTVPTLLDWKEKTNSNFVTYHYGITDGEEKVLPRIDASDCRWCKTPLFVREWEIRDAEYDFSKETRRTCPLCGWHTLYSCRYEADGCVDPSGVWEESMSSAILQSTSSQQPQKVIRQISDFVRGDPSWITSISPRAFEKLVAESLSGTGFEVQLTQQTRDGGIDVYCVDRASGEVMVVECKHRRLGKPVGVFVARELVGAMVDWQVRKAQLITTGVFSQAVKDYAGRVRTVGFDLALIDFDGLLKLLDLFQSNVVGLARMSDVERQGVVQFNNELLADMGYRKISR
jgi:restriction system protein